MHLTLISTKPRGVGGGQVKCNEKERSSRALSGLLSRIWVDI